MKKIVVLLHQHDTAFTSFGYLIKLMMKEWEHIGFAVETVRGIDSFVPADIVIPHIDLTVTPEPYRAFLDQYPLVVNRSVVDISKSKISANLVTAGDSYSGPVIIKTDRNHGGLSERCLSGGLSQIHSKAWNFLGRITSKRRQKRAEDVSWLRVQYLAPAAYPVFLSLQEVPADVFLNKNLVVEKFRPEIEQGYYCLRSNFVFGDFEVNTVLRSRQPVVKLANSVHVEGESTPPEVYAFRQRSGINYGKIDYVVRDGEAVVFDFNRTSTIEASELGNKVARHLAQAICSKLSEVEAT